MDGLIYRTLEAVRTGLQVVNNRLQIELYEGIFDDEAVDRVLTRSGRVHLTFLEASPSMDRPGGEMILAASYGAYVATSRGNKIQTGINEIEAVAAGLLQLSRDETFKMPAYTMPVVLGEIQNLFTTKAGDRSIALYGMSFAVPIVIGQAAFAGDTEVYDPTRFTFELDDAGDGATVLDTKNTERLEPGS